MFFSPGFIFYFEVLIPTFGLQIIPQSLCTRYGLAIGATVAPIVRVLIWFWFPVAYPISKVPTFLSVFTRNAAYIAYLQNQYV